MNWVVKYLMLFIKYYRKAVLLIVDKEICVKYDVVTTNFTVLTLTMDEDMNYVLRHRTECAAHERISVQRNCKDDSFIRQGSLVVYLLVRVFCNCFCNNYVKSVSTYVLTRIRY